MERLISACTTHGERARDREEADADVDVRRLRLRPTRGTQDLSLTQRRKDETRRDEEGGKWADRVRERRHPEGRRQEMDTKGTVGKATDD